MPGSKLLFPLFALSILLGCYRFLRQRDVPVLLASLGPLLLLSAPHIFLHSTVGFANLPFTTYLVLGTLWCVDGLFENKPRSLLMGGIMLVLAGWTRPEGIGFVLIIQTSLVLIYWLSGHKGLRIMPLFIPTLLIVGVWLIFGAEHLSNDQVWGVTRVFRKEIAEGSLAIEALASILTFVAKRAVTLTVWGLLFPLILILLIWRSRNLLPRHNPITFSFLCVSILALLVPIGLFFVASYSRPNFPFILEINFDRALFPAIFLGMVVALLAVNKKLMSAVSG
ncbi:MAG: hypothetical protein GTO18_22365 [Anaerolineales bacterium]|nr:hypothetical protein [Anaerolineales bacterium]